MGCYQNTDRRIATYSIASLRGTNDLIQQPLLLVWKGQVANLKSLFGYWRRPNQSVIDCGVFGSFVKELFHCRPTLTFSLLYLHFVDV